MGGVSIAVEDTLLDPFTNPAKGSRLGAARFFGSPSVYSVSSQGGAGRTLPVGAMMRTGSWYGGLSIALQEVDLSQRNGFPTIFACPACNTAAIDLGPIEQSHGNTYVFAMLGRALSAGLSLGGSVLWSGLHAVDGVDLLYANSARIKQYHQTVRGRSRCAARNAQGMDGRPFARSHRVAQPVRDDARCLLPRQLLGSGRTAVFLDRTSTWGLHVEYEHPITATGWRLGWLATANRMSHPKIPNYEIMNIPRDPGHSSAFNVGVGISRTHEASTFGIDVIYEPIFSHTWADSEVPIETERGETIPAGGKTIENQFRFSNALFRMGFGQELDIGDGGMGAGLQFGLMVRSIHYWLDQENHIQISARSHEERWMEWTPTWGFSVRFPELEIRYRGRVTNGTGRPGVAGPPVGVLEDSAVGSNILVAPSGPLTLDEVRVVTHQISLSLPLR
jgi:hypothetical protein